MNLSIHLEISIYDFMTSIIFILMVTKIKMQNFVEKIPKPLIFLANQPIYFSLGETSFTFYLFTNKTKWYKPLNEIFNIHTIYKSLC